MSELAISQEQVGGRDGLLRAMLASLRDYWTRAEVYQKFAYATGFLLIGSAVFHTIVLVVTGGTLEGDLSWRKPILFGEAFGLTVVSVAWVMTFLPKRPRLGWLLLGTLSVANFGEVFWVSIQQWRGVPSHFNTTTTFDALAFFGAGALILFAATVIIVVTVLTFFSLQAPSGLVLAIRTGMLLLVATQFFGLVMILVSGHTFGAAGDMKVPHGLSLHGIQVLPVLAWLLLFTPWSESRRTRAVALAAAGYTGLVTASAVQTYSGRAPLDLTLPVALILGLSVASVAAAFAIALIGLMQNGSPGPPEPVTT